jgi:hypothetical protein
MATKGGSRYEVGYGRPPRHSRFQKGQSGNPKGRARGSKNFTTLLKEALDEPVSVNENGRRKTISKKAAIAKQAVNKAAAGDLRALPLPLLNHMLAEAGTELAQAMKGPALPPPPSAEQKRTRALEIAKILKQVGHFDQPQTDSVDAQVNPAKSPG